MSNDPIPQTVLEEFLAQLEPMEEIDSFRIDQLKEHLLASTKPKAATLIDILSREPEEEVE